MRNERNQIGSSGSSSGGLVAGGSSSAVNMGTSSGEGNLGSRSSSVGGAGGSASGGPSTGNVIAERDSFSRWRDRQYYGPRRWFQSAREDSQWDKDNGKYFFISAWLD